MQGNGEVDFTPQNWPSVVGGNLKESLASSISEEICSEKKVLKDFSGVNFKDAPVIVHSMRADGFVDIKVIWDNSFWSEFSPHDRASIVIRAYQLAFGDKFSDFFANVGSVFGFVSDDSAIQDLIRSYT